MKILITEPENYSQKALEIYQSVGRIVYDKKLTRSELLREIADADVLVIRLAHVIDREVLDRAKNLRVIASPTTGLNHIDLEYAAERSVKVISLKGEVDFLRTISATAEHTFALLLGLMRKIPWNFDSVVREGQWDRDTFKGRELAGKTLGILGFGRLGSRVAKMAQAFDMKVIAHDPYVAKSDMESAGVTPVEIDDLLEHADIVTVHVALSPETKNLLSAEKVSKMKNGAILVNTSRGEIIDEEALLAGLESGKISGAALDVLSDELSWGENKKIVYGNSSLRLIEYARTHNNLLITSHIGGATYESMEKTEIFIANKIKEFLSLSQK